MTHYVRSLSWYTMGMFANAIQTLLRVISCPALQRKSTIGCGRDGASSLIVYITKNCLYRIFSLNIYLQMMPSITRNRFSSILVQSVCATRQSNSRQIMLSFRCWLDYGNSLLVYSLHFIQNAEMCTHLFFMVQRLRLRFFFSFLQKHSSSMALKFGEPRTLEKHKISHFVRHINCIKGDSCYYSSLVWNWLL